MISICRIFDSSSLRQMHVFLLGVAGLVAAAALRQPGVSSRRRSSLRSESSLMQSEEQLAPASFAERLFSEVAEASPPAGEGGAVGGMRARGRGLLGGLRRPSGRDEAWRFTNMRTLFEPAYGAAAGGGRLSSADLAPFVEPTCSEAMAVLVDGEFREDLSILPEGFTISSARALNSEPAVLAMNQETLPGIQCRVLLCFQLFDAQTRGKSLGTPSGRTPWLRWDWPPRPTPS